jgi:hypothetical protein
MIRPRSGPSLSSLAATIVGGILIAPWILGFSTSHAAVAGHIAFAMTFGPIALLVTALPAAALTTAAAGAWLAVSPWALGFASYGIPAWGTNLTAGLALVAVGHRAWRRTRSRTPARATPFAPRP